MKRWLKIVAAAFMSAALVLTMIPLAGDSAFADCNEPGTENPGSEDACQS